MNRKSAMVETPEHAGLRIDRYVAEIMAILSRSQLKHREARLLVNGKEVKPSYRLAVGDAVVVEYADEVQSTILGEPVPLDVIFENDEVIVINKPVGMVVHPAAGNASGTLVQGLAYRYESLRHELQAGNPRPGIVHRLDKDTSGVIISAKNPEARRFLANQFRKRRTEKVYLAVVKGRLMPRAGDISSFIRRDPHHRKRFMSDPEIGKAAETSYTVLKQWERYAFVALRPKTGRTHQLRVHLASKGTPILGDPLYARSDPQFPDAGLMLHAHRLRIVLPRPGDAGTYVGGEPATFRAPLPDRFKRVLREIAAEATTTG